MKKNRWALFISGRGSNMATFLDSQDEIEIGLVISNRPDAYGLARARRMGVRTLIMDQKMDWQKIHQTLLDLKINSIFLAGFMKIIPADFLSKWQGEIFNIHPSLLPHYPGLKSIARAFEDGGPIGATVHEVIPEVDQGNICSQGVGVSVSDMEKKTLSQCEFLVHIVEHQLVRSWVKKWTIRTTSYC